MNTEEKSPEVSESSPHIQGVKLSTSWVERAMRAMINVLLVLIVALLSLLTWDRINGPIKNSQPSVSSVDRENSSSKQPSADQPEGQEIEVLFTSLENAAPAKISSVSRTALLKTFIPSRPRVDVITYTVQTGDSLFSIADIFSLKPETLLWGNFETLEDNPHLLKEGQVLNILPINGTYYQWHAGDNLASIAAFFQVEPEAILSYPGNRIDLTSGDLSAPAIEPDSWVIIPGGKRAIKDWGPPAISRSNPASARYYGAGHCGSIYEGAIGSGTFVWPTPSHSISGYGYGSIHPAIDIGGAIGNAIFASDSGVIVYAGWSDYGYGYMIVIDHGNGWQTAYAHLSAVAVTCGQSVFQGGYIGGLGSTGNSTGPHLHFELVYGGAKLNPLDYLP